MVKTITRSDLSDAVYQELGLSKSESSDLVEMIIDGMISSLTKGANVKVSSFGTFLVRSKKARIGRNPKTGKEHEISARKVVVFRPSHTLRSIVRTIKLDKS